MTLTQLEHFRTQVIAQMTTKQSQTPTPGQELFYYLGSIELQVGLNLINQLIILEQAQLAAPPGPTGPTV